MSLTTPLASSSTAAHAGFSDAAHAGPSTIQNFPFVSSSSRLSEPPDSISSFFAPLERMNIISLHGLAKRHGLDPATARNMSALRDDLVTHFTLGLCKISSAHACSSIMHESAENVNTAESLKIHILSTIRKTIKRKPLHRLLELHDVPFQANDSTSALRRHLRKHISTLKKGKRSVQSGHEHAAALNTIRDEWPRLVSSSLKQKLVSMFRDATSSEALAEFTCASCAESCPIKCWTQVAS